MLWDVALKSVIGACVEKYKAVDAAEQILQVHSYIYLYVYVHIFEYAYLCIHVYLYM